MYKRMLIVDDDPGMRMLLRLMLRTTDYEIVAEAEDGEHAVALYDEVQPDCVVLDLMLPRIDGMTVLKRIMRAHPRAQVVICSVMRHGDTVREAYAAGARDYITKPFGPAELQLALTRTCSGPAPPA